MYGLGFRVVMHTYNIQTTYVCMYRDNSHAFYLAP